MVTSSSKDYLLPSENEENRANFNEKTHLNVHVLARLTLIKLRIKLLCSVKKKIVSYFIFTTFILSIYAINAPEIGTE